MSEKNEICENREKTRECGQKDGGVSLKGPAGAIHCMSIIGQIEGHYISQENQKATKYEHIIPMLVSIEQDREISRQLDNAVTAILNGMNSPALQKRVAELEAQQAQISHDMKQLKASVDASAIPEARLRELLQEITSSDDNASILLSAVYRVEVAPDTITVWTILDADPTGTIDPTLDGVTITPCFPSGVPTIIVTSDFIRITVAR